MQRLPSSLDELLAVADVAEPGLGDAGLVSQQLEACAPLLLLLADATGQVIFTDDFGTGVSVASVQALADELSCALAGRRACQFTVSCEAGCKLAFGVRLPDPAGSGIVGCLLESAGLSGMPSGDLQASTVVSAALAWAIGHNVARDAELRTRVAHLQAEHETLRSAQAHAVAAAIDEREQRLRQQRLDMARLEAVMKLAAEGIITYDEAGTVESFNEAAGRIFGYDPDEVIGHNVSMLIPEQHHEPAGGWPGDYLHPGESPVAGIPREVRGQRKDGTVFPLEIATSEVPLDGGRLLTGIFRDITERRRLERQLLQAQKMESVGQLAAGIAHEINTPTQYVGDNTRFLEDAFRDLAPLLAHCDRLRAQADNVSEQLIADVVTASSEADLEYLIEEIPNAIAQSLEGVQRVAKIVRSMKEFSHPGCETKQAVDLNRALESTLTVCRNEWKYVADATTDFAPDLPLVTCLACECNQVFLNLIINAAHAIGDKVADGSMERGLITVATRRDGDWAEIRVTDNGSGIPDHACPKIFDPFFTTKEVGRGTGQGLAIAHAVVTEKHGGTIDVETALGRGTTFIVRLPVDDVPSSPEGATSEEADLVC